MFIDTNILIVMHTNPARLKKRWQNILGDPSTSLFTSAVCIWEIAIKYSQKKPGFGINPAHIMAACHDTGMTILDLTPDVARMVADLPLHHKDPFDRLIIAQALELGIPVMTTDKMFKKYDVALA